MSTIFMDLAGRASYATRMLEMPSKDVAAKYAG